MTAQYKHTGEITGPGMLFGLLGGVLAALVLSIPYAYITVYVPFIYLNLLATFGFGLAVGLCVAKGARKGNLQAPFMYGVIGVVCGLVAEYFNWVFWIFAASGQEVLTFHPLGILAVASGVLEEGTWGLTSGGNLTGIPLLCVWVGEAVMIVGVAVATALDGIKKFLCCPACKKWFDSPTKSLYYEIPEQLDQVVAQLSDLKFKCLSDLKSTDAAKARKFLAVDLFFCPACSGFGCFTVKTTELRKKKKGEDEAVHVTLIDKFVLPTDRLSELVA